MIVILRKSIIKLPKKIVTILKRIGLTKINSTKMFTEGSRELTFIKRHQTLFLIVSEEDSRNLEFSKNGKFKPTRKTSKLHELH